MEYGRILTEVLKEIKPVDKPKEVGKTIKKINQELKRKKIRAKAMVGGSFAKNTHLKDKHDVDVFVKFNLKYKKEDISELLGETLKKFKPVKVHGSRDYYHLKIGKLNFEVVPVLDIKKPQDAENVTDFSPGHVTWVKKNIRKLHDDVRLAKKFCQAQQVYGAESYIKGFSGHVIDILVIYYKGFIPLLKASLKWEPKKVIDFYNKHKGKALEKLNFAKIQCPLIVIDPVQSERNASSALGYEKFRIFKQEAALFLRNPHADYFEEKKIDVEKLKQRGAIIIEVAPKKGKIDVVGSKILRVFELCKRQLAEFRIVDAEWEWDKKGKAILWFLLGEKELGEEREQEGPPVYHKDDVNKFKKKHKNTFVKNKRIYAMVKRKFIKARPLLKALFKDENVRKRVRKCSLKS